VGFSSDVKILPHQVLFRSMTMSQFFHSIHSKLLHSQKCKYPTNFLSTMKRFVSLRPLQASRTNRTSLRLLTVILPRANTRINTNQTRSFSNTKMSFSNTNTGDKPADPYKEKNIDEASIKDKVEDLSEFITACKFGMMTTRDGSSGALVSRCMALAAKVCQHQMYPHLSRSNSHIGKWRHRPDLPHQHRIRQDLRHRLRPPHQHLLPQLLRRMGIRFWNLIDRHRPVCRQEILLSSSEGMVGRFR
jgi:hypothetical protein